jgi:drug/metabolite transporter (DMT)-like permease
MSETTKARAAPPTATASQRRTRLDGLAIVLLVGCCALWGFNQVAVKAVLPEVPPLVQAAVRSLGAALLVLAWAAWRGIPMWNRDGTLVGGLAAGALFAVEFACIFIGLAYTGASRMAVFIYLSPFVVALGMPFIAKSERLTAPVLVGLVMAFAGVAWAFAEGFARPSIGPHQWLGDALGIAAAVLWGATTLVIRATVLASAPAEKTLFYQLAVSGLGLGVAALVTGQAGDDTAWLALSQQAWSSLVFQTVVVTFASYLVWFWLIRHYPATRLAAFTLLTPLFGLGFGAWLLGEPLTPRLLLAATAVAAGIAVMNLVKPRPR